MMAGKKREGEMFLEYIGDGVYASYDGWHVWLRCDREGGVHEVGLEPGVRVALTRYIADLATRRERGGEP